LRSQTKGLLARWYLRLSQFLPLMKLEFKPGHANVVADCLSRAPVESIPDEIRRVISEESILAKVQKEQQQDEELADLMEYLECKQSAIRREKVLAAAQRGYYVSQGILYYESAEVPNRQCLVVPAHLHQQVVNENHNPVFAGNFSEKN